MKGTDHNRLLELGLRRKLTREEELELESHYASHPDRGRAMEALEEENRLNLLVRNLPNYPVASNFTARVLRTVAAESRGKAPRPRGRWGLPLPSFQWVGGTALAMLLVSAGLFSYYHHQISVRVERAQSVATVSSVASIPTLEMLQDFEAIHRLSHAPKETDWDLLLTALP
jgi:hypothetical protein